MLIEDQAQLFQLFSVAKELGSQEYAQLQRHIKPRQFGIGIGLIAGQIVNAEAAIANDAVDSLNPILTSVR
jgi:hypothetical protein